MFCLFSSHASKLITNANHVFVFIYNFVWKHKIPFKWGMPFTQTDRILRKTRLSLSTKTKTEIWALLWKCVNQNEIFWIRIFLAKYIGFKLYAIYSVLAKKTRNILFLVFAKSVDHVQNNNTFEESFCTGIRALLFLTNRYFDPFVSEFHALTNFEYMIIRDCSDDHSMPFNSYFIWIQIYW